MDSKVKKGLLGRFFKKTDKKTEEIRRDPQTPAQTEEGAVSETQAHGFKLDLDGLEDEALSPPETHAAEGPDDVELEMDIPGARPTPAQDTPAPAPRPQLASQPDPVRLESPPRVQTPSEIHSALSDVSSPTAATDRAPTSLSASTGVVKSPITDRLGIESYAEGLAKYLQTCDTPRSVAVEGERGSGRTSLLDMVGSKIDRSSVIPIWFNPATYNHFSFPEQLPLILVKRVLAELELALANTSGTAVRDRVPHALRNLQTAASSARSVSARREGDANAALGYDPLASGPASEAVDALKLDLADIIDEGAKAAGKERLLVLVDDLESLGPERALQFMKGTQTFLSVPRCVFLVICNASTVREAVGRSLPAGDPDAHAAATYERLFANTFHMPGQVHNAGDFLGKLFSKLGLKGSALQEGDLTDFVHLLNLSIGSNARKIDTIANSILLMSNLPVENHAGEPDTPVDYRSDVKKLKTLFAVACMEKAFPKLYRILLGKTHDPRDMAEFVDRQLANEDRLEILDAQVDLFDGGNRLRQVLRLNRFLQLVLGILDLDADGRLSSKEIKNLIDALRLVAVATSNDVASLEDDPGRQGINYFVGKVKERLMEMDSAPNRSHRVLQGSPRFPWIGLWYTMDDDKATWGPDSLYYFMKFNRDNFNELTLGMAFSIDGLKRKGAPESTIKRVQVLQFWAQNGFQYRRPGKDKVELSKSLFEVACNSVEDVRDDEVERVFFEMKDLIAATHDLFDRSEQKSKSRSSSKRSDQRKESQIRFQCPKCKDMAMVEVGRQADGTIRYRCTECGQKAKQSPQY